MRRASRGLAAALAAVVVLASGVLVIHAAEDPGAEGALCSAADDDATCIARLGSDTLAALVNACAMDLPEDIDQCIRIRARELGQTPPQVDAADATQAAPDAVQPAPGPAQPAPEAGQPAPDAGQPAADVGQPAPEPVLAPPPQTRTIGPAVVVTQPFSRPAPAAAQTEEVHPLPPVQHQPLPPGPPNRHP
jgi:hypothetical protein